MKRLRRRRLLLALLAGAALTGGALAWRHAAGRAGRARRRLGAALQCWHEGHDPQRTVLGYFQCRRECGTRGWDLSAFGNGAEGYVRGGRA